MTNPYIEFSFDPDISHMQRKIRKLIRSLEHFEEPLVAAVKGIIIPSLKTNFVVGGRPRWEPLSDFTLQRRERQGTGNKILDETGRLKRVATSFARWRFTDDTAFVLPSSFPRDRRIVALVHQSGAQGTGRNRTVNITARPYMVIQPVDAARVEALFATWIDKQVDRNWVRR